MKITCNQLSKLEIFKGISENTLKRILEVSEVNTHEKKEILFKDKQEVNIIYFIIDGCVSLYKLNENGQKKIIFVMDRGKVINEVIMQDIPSSINCEIFEKATLLEVKRDKFIEIMRDDFDLCVRIMVSLSSKTRRLYRQLKNTPSSIKLEKKLAAKLYKLGRDYGVKTDKGIIINKDITVTYLADLIGSQRETVSRAIKVLEKEGLIAHKSKKITIFDINNLTAFFKKV